ncbi:MAG: bifunctional (p)ppGpp synthetase/guanosine-3',5'-bis(diphosphate) 3'-pyrophosphohydrolase [Acidimicrobiia bacterium]|nr:bifunctional (p)ppGpp synthetase/guanosine-3',5'-bis(diphosphate) 3'-pyrophosphohydrolase [Acidimicrobiia bacterium]MCY4432699.1 bifunctional (p)ppGpp synthetase/guanosine-3',5'-bis(diphosphate) 3'-pyrophosphohydrolase [bacterium]
MTLTERPLPWMDQPGQDVGPLLDAYLERHPNDTAERIETAYRLAEQAHSGQKRKSGEPYVTHPLAVAHIVVDLGLDDVSVIAALLHDAIEDTAMGLSEVEQHFGGEVASIVDSVTRLDRLQFNSQEEEQAASMRKMLVAIAKDLRVLVVKLSDRLHNMRTLAALPLAKQHRVARETIDIYAPLANRLGMQDMKLQLEDLAFAALHPKRYAEIDRMVATRAPERDLYLTQVLSSVEARLAELGIPAQVTGRPKHLWSIYEKMMTKDRSFDEIFDLVGIRVIVESVRDCYAALGSIHATWKPVQGRFKDYIAMPKFNLYQSLHTSVVGPGGKSLEVQLRTNEMHARAEQGVAAHYSYKEGATIDDLAWLSRIIDWQQETSDAVEFLSNLKTDLDHDEVQVFTPKGDVVSLPMGAIPIDFAYSIHTEVGHACIGARVNGQLVPLDRELRPGDMVEIFTSKVADKGPSRDWLGLVASHRARNKIRQWFAQARREDAIKAGRDAVAAALRRERLPVARILAGDELVHAATDMNYRDLDTLFAAVGERHVSAKAVAERVAGMRVEPSAEEEGMEGDLAAVPSPSVLPRKTEQSVEVEGLDDVLVNLARCCKPVPPDEIIGFVTRGRGVSVHRTECANAVSLSFEQGDRLIDVDWSAERTGAYCVTIEVKAFDRTSLLRDVANALSTGSVNILACETRTGADQISVMRFDFELIDSTHLDALLRTIRGIESVYNAYRVLPTASGS